MEGLVRGIGRERKQIAAPQQRRCAGGQVEFPEFASVGAVVGDEEQRAVPGGERLGIGAVGAGAEVRRADGARGGAVAAPEFPVAVAGVGAEPEQVAAGSGQFFGSRIEEVVVDVFHEHGARRGAVGAPEFAALEAVVRGKIEIIAAGQEGRGVVARLKHGDVFEQVGAVLRAVGGPEHTVGGEKDFPLERMEFARVGAVGSARLDLPESESARFGAVADPGLAVERMIVGRKVEFAVEGNHVLDVGIALAGGNLPDTEGTRGRAVGGPEFAVGTGEV